MKQQNVNEFYKHLFVSAKIKKNKGPNFVSFFSVVGEWTNVNYKVAWKNAWNWNQNCDAFYAHPKYTPIS